MENVLIVIHLMVVLALVIVVLLQRSEGGGLGMGGGGGGFMTGRGQANLLTRTTAILAAVFFATSLTLSILAGRTSGGGSLFTPQTAPANAPVAPAAPPAGDNLLDQLRRQSGQTPAPAPASPAPSAPAPSNAAPPAPAPAAPSQP